jgi:AraC-like DNA-binding protein
MIRREKILEGITIVGGWTALLTALRGGEGALSLSASMRMFLFLLGGSILLSSFHLRTEPWACILRVILFSLLGPMLFQSCLDGVKQAAVYRVRLFLLHCIPIVGVGLVVFYIELWNQKRLFGLTSGQVATVLSSAWLSVCSIGTLTYAEKTTSSVIRRLRQLLAFGLLGLSVSSGIISLLHFNALEYVALLSSIAMLPLHFMLSNGSSITSPKLSASRSYIHNLDLIKLEDRLNQLMLQEKIFCDEDLSLAKLAEELEITIHQLSQFLNQNLGKNFYNYINMFRVTEAKNLLIDEPERSVLSVAFAVGFNSYSSFHRSFCKDVGLTPKEFRKRFVGRISDRSIKGLEEVVNGQSLSNLN